MNNVSTEQTKGNQYQVPKAQNILVVGATGGTGKATVKKLLEQGHNVTAFSRSATGLKNEFKGLRCIDGDANDPAQIELVVEGHDAVIITLGIQENPLKVRFFGASDTLNQIRSNGTKNVIQAMQNKGVKKLVVQSSYGVGETRGNLGFVDQLFFSLILKPQIADTERQEKIVRESDLEWVIVQPVHLTDALDETAVFASTQGETQVMKVARDAVAQFMVSAMNNISLIGKSVAVSAKEQKYV